MIPVALGEEEVRGRERGLSDESTPSLLLPHLGPLRYPIQQESHFADRDHVKLAKEWYPQDVFTAM